MKKIITIIIAIISLQSLYSQDNISLFYITEVQIELKECDYDGIVVSTSDSLKTIPANSKFTIQNKKDGKYIISFWSWDVNDSIKELNEVPEKYKNVNSNENNETKYLNLNYKVANGEHATRYFLLNDFHFKNSVRELKAFWEPTVGTLVLPVKFRMSPFDFSKDITISGTGGVKWNFNQKRKMSLSIIAGLGISSVSLDSTSTNGIVKDSEDRAALSALGGVVLQWQFLQIGSFIGGDWLARKNEDSWIYQAKPWIGFGIGVSLYSKDVNAKTEKKNTK